MLLKRVMTTQVTDHLPIHSNHTEGYRYASEGQKIYVLPGTTKKVN